VHTASVLCAGSPNIAYPAQGVSAGHPHAPSSICGSAVTYDANGNMLAYDPDGSGPIPARAIAYAPDGSRAAKLSGFGTLAQSDYYLSADADILVNSANPTTSITSNHANMVVLITFLI